jgi:hypothetical protein
MISKNWGKEKVKADSIGWMEEKKDKGSPQHLADYIQKT